MTALRSQGYRFLRKFQDGRAGLTARSQATSLLTSAVLLSVLNLQFVNAQEPTGRIVAGVVISISQDSLTLYRARFDSSTPGGTERVTLSITPRTRVFVGDTPAGPNSIRLDQPVIVRLEGQSSRFVAEIRAGGTRAGRQTVPPKAGERPSTSVPVRAQVITGDIREATPDHLVLELDRALNSLPKGARFNLEVNRRTPVRYLERPVDLLDIQTGGKATISYLEEAGRFIATDINLLAGSRPYRPAGISEDQANPPGKGKFNFFALRLQKSQDANSPRLTEIRAGDSMVLTFSVLYDGVVADSVHYEISLRSMGKQQMRVESTDSLKRPNVDSFTGLTQQHFTLKSPGDIGADSAIEITGIVRINGVSQERTLRFWATPTQSERR